MMRKFILLLLLCIGSYGFASAQTEDSVQIYLPWGSDTTCPGTQLTFTAVETNDTAIGTIFRWYANGVYTGVSIDTFITTALNDGDTVHCEIFFTNSGGFLDSALSNTITVHRSNSIMPAVLIALTAGSNPDCPGHPLTFTAYPATGGPSPLYQWRVDGVDIAGATSNTYTNIFNDGDTLSCMMVSNSPCASPTDTAYSNIIEVVHDSLTATLGITVDWNPICQGTPDTLRATTTDAGLGSTIYWFVNGTPVVGALGPQYMTDSLDNGDIVYAMLVATDACVINDTTISSPITMTVLPNLNPTAHIVMTHGANPGCIDSALTFTATYTDGGLAPDLLWLINDTVRGTGSTFTRTYRDGDLLTFRLRTTDGGCYVNDSVTTTAVLMVRDSTPVAPLVSLIDNMLVANTGGSYVWYFNGVIIPGANSHTYHPGTIGYYYARRDTGNCLSEPSNTIYIALLKAGMVGAGSYVNVYPNPTGGMVTVDLGDRSNVQARITVANVIGQVVYSAETNRQKHEADLGNLPNGNYILTVRDDAGNVSTHKVTLAK
ncbi:hypothetical protein GCM10023093_21280 [Nemorincola caseinilytica]|uniref:Secretion system C-terminal sorting domain-containing protein n=1 Tax=Nemorincola caseinilytica TaxID=2054315 RepID=A0ABP8NJ72_9BACT